MSGNIVSIGCNILTGIGKKGNLNCDTNGYYEIALGAFDVHNAQGEFYPFTSELKQMFTNSAALMRRIQKGYLRGEAEHPAPLPGQSIDAFLNRWRTVRMDNVASHIASVRLSYEKDHRGKNIVVCYGRVKGSGPHEAGTNKMLANTEENVAYSIRSLTEPRLVNGQKHKCITGIVTWDLVNEPGIELANKYQTPSMESRDQLIITPDILNKAEQDPMAGLVGQESDMSLTMLRTALGWQKVQVNSAMSRLQEW